MQLPNVSYESVVKKWEKVLVAEGLDPITDTHRRNVTAVLLENTNNAIKEQNATRMLYEGVPTNVMGASATSATGGNIDYVDPVLINLIRRSAPNMMAYDVCGVQPMSGPTGLIFAIRSRYTNQTGTEALFNEANSAFSAIPAGANASAAEWYPNGQSGGSPNQLSVSNSSNWTGYTYQTGMPTANGEILGANATYAIPEMSMSIERVSVTATTRKLKAEYSLELQQDLKALHGLDAEKELSNILSTELLAEINRQVIRTINATATVGAQSKTATAGTFDLDVDSNGRWMNEKFLGLSFFLDTEANEISRLTRRGRGNVLICSQDVASALKSAGKLDTSSLKGNLRDNGIVENTFVGTVGNIKVYVDPYFLSNDGSQYATLGFKGANAYDAGLFYCPYVPLTMVRAVDPDTFQPKFGFQTRYGMVANPFATSSADGAVDPTKKNIYYRIIKITNIL